MVFIWYGRTALRAQRAVAAGMQRATPGSKQLLELKSNLAFLLAQGGTLTATGWLSTIIVVKFEDIVFKVTWPLFGIYFY